MKQKWIKIKNTMLSYFNWFFNSFFTRWKHRDIDPELCCCGEIMTKKTNRLDSICCHGGCRSLKEYLITSEKINCLNQNKNETIYSMRGPQKGK